MKEIPCPHRRAGFDLRVTLPDYHPLTKGEIGALLDEAREKKKTFDLIRISVRLVQGIPGMICPRPEEGPLGEKMVRLYDCFCANRNKGADPKLVAELYRIMVG